MLQSLALGSFPVGEHAGELELDIVDDEEAEVEILQGNPEEDEGEYEDQQPAEMEEEGEQDESNDMEAEFPPNNQSKTREIRNQHQQENEAGQNGHQDVDREEQTITVSEQDEEAIDHPYREDREEPMAPFSQRQREELDINTPEPTLPPLGEFDLGQQQEVHTLQVSGNGNPELARADENRTDRDNSQIATAIVNLLSQNLSNSVFDLLDRLDGHYVRGHKPNPSGQGPSTSSHQF